jgi:sensor histidine kinase YesM
MRDSILNDQIKAKLIAYGPQQKIKLLNKEKEIQQAKLQKESIIKNSFIAGSIGLLLLGFIISRNIILKRKNEKLRLEYELELQQSESEKTKAELEQQAIELEMQALRAQMNPHFLFNTLSFINRFILKNDKARASAYLTKVSKLVRMILQNSQDATIPLEGELEALQLYLELEALRYDHRFSYALLVSPEIDVAAVKVPPLLIQPFAENAIWHGLMHKEDKGHIDIKLYREGEALCCKITDDGVGRNKAKEMKAGSAPTHKSMGMHVTASRIAMLQHNRNLGSGVIITDLVLRDGSPAGTEVLFKIPMVYG